MNHTIHVLVVDDEPNIRASLQEILTSDGYQVTTAESGEAALALIADQEFDIALIDLKMKGIGGIEVLKALRQRWPATVTIVLTAHASLETAVEAVRQGAHDYLFKPCAPAQLRESIQRGLQNRQTVQQQATLLQQLEEMANNLAEIRSTLLETSPKSPLATPDTPTRDAGQSTRFIQYGKLVLDLLRHVVTFEKHILDLTPMEFDLLAFLIQEAPRIVSPQEIVQHVGGFESERIEASEIVRQHIYRIRKKARQIDSQAEIIRTVRGIGYTIEA